MAVILKKEEKISSVSDALPDNYVLDDFILKFKELYPKDWNKLEKSYNDHERKTKPGKSHPMPNPEQYLKNALNIWKTKANEGV